MLVGYTLFVVVVVFLLFFGGRGGGGGGGGGGRVCVTKFYVELISMTVLMTGHH